MPKKMTANAKKSSLAYNTLMDIDTVKSIVELCKTGLKSRAVSMQVFGKESRKSIINYIYSAYNADCLYVSGTPYQYYDGPSSPTTQPVDTNTTPLFQKEPKILIFDIETAPFLAYAWSRFKNYTSDAQVVQEGYVLCWAAKWLGNDNIMFDSIWQHDAKVSEGNDYEVCKSLHALFDEADIVVAHNGNRFDVPLMNTRFLFHRLPPNTPYKKVDTLSILRHNFMLPSNKLSSAAIYLGLTDKMDAGGFHTWLGCINGDEEHQEHMLTYNIQDVLTLEELYLRVRPWYNSHPNVSLYYSNPTNRCPCCGSVNVTTQNPDTHTAVSAMTVYPLVICNNCGKRSRKATKLSSSVGVLRNIP